MSLNAQQKDALVFQLLELVNHDEPNAFLVTLHRIAETQAFHEMRRHADYHQALRWQVIADALSHASLELLKSQSSSNPI